MSEFFKMSKWVKLVPKSVSYKNHPKFDILMQKMSFLKKINYTIYIGVFGVKPWNSPKKIKVPIDGSPTKTQKTMGTLIFLLNSTVFLLNYEHTEELPKESI